MGRRYSSIKKEFAECEARRSAEEEHRRTVIAARGQKRSWAAVEMEEDDDEEEEEELSPQESFPESGNKEAYGDGDQASPGGLPSIELGVGSKPSQASARLVHPLLSSLAEEINGLVAVCVFRDHELELSLISLLIYREGTSTCRHLRTESRSLPTPLFVYMLLRQLSLRVSHYTSVAVAKEAGSIKRVAS